MQEANKQHHDFNTSLPYIRQNEPIEGKDSTYVQYLFDSINPGNTGSDFIFQLKDIVLPQLTDSINDTIELKPSVLFPFKESPVVIEPKIRTEASYDWLTGLFILCLIIITWAKYESGRRVTQMFKAVIARHNMNQLLRDGDLIHERITPGLMFVSLISISTLALLLFVQYTPGIIDGQVTTNTYLSIPFTDNTFLIFSTLASFIFILWLLKLTAIKISGIIFRTRAESNEYLITNLLFNITAGMVAFPFVLIGHYAENQVSIIIAVVIFIFVMLARFVRSIFVGLSAQTFPVVYLFLYLCTLEILPILVLYKLLSS